LTAAESAEFVGTAEETLNLLHQLLDSGELVVLKQVPADLDVVHDLADWLNSIHQPLKIASAPNVRP
jgi:hypothetical protein